MGFKEKIAHGATKAKLGAKEAAPKLMIFGGVGLIVAAGVWACKKTRTELDGVLAQHKEQLEALHEVREDLKNGKEVKLPDGSLYTEDKLKKHIAYTYWQTFLRLCKVYGLPVAMAVCGITSIGFGTKIIDDRRIAAAAETYAVSEAYKEYRKRVRDELGEEAEEALFKNAKKEFVSEETTDPETGEVKTESKGELICKKIDGDLDIYTYIFDECNAPNSWSKNPGYNYQFLIGMQNNANEYLKRHGAITLYEVLKSLGMRDIPADTMTLGWMIDNPTGYGDGFVDFGITKLGVHDDVGFYLGGTPDYKLVFNCDGDIQAAMKIAQKAKKDKLGRVAKERKKMLARVPKI